MKRQALVFPTKVGIQSSLCYYVDSHGRYGPTVKEALMKRYPDIQLLDLGQRAVKIGIIGRPPGCFPTNRDATKTGGALSVTIGW